MMQVIDQTHEEQMKMYMKLTKKKLAEMLIECNRITVTGLCLLPFSNKLRIADVSGSLPFKKCGEGDNVCNCKNADECGYL